MENSKKFIVEDSVNAVYRSVFLAKESGLTPEEEETLSAMYKPPFTIRTFSELFETSFKEINEEMKELEAVKDAKNIDIAAQKKLFALIADNRNL